MGAMTLWSGLGDGIALDWTKAPHVLVAGMTGSGKSVLMTSIINELIDTYSPWQLVMHMVDPKRVELSAFADAPHLLDPPAYANDDAIHYLKWAVEEMGKRFWAMSDAGVRDVDDLPRPFAHYLFIVDELANLMLQRRKAVEPLIVQLATMGRAAGIHLLLGTQRPSADVLTGLLRSNIPTRISLPVLTQWDSRIILDETGAEKLEQPGDCLARLPGSRKLQRFRARYTSDEDVQRVVQSAISRTAMMQSNG